ncbi:MAG TPA: extracellular solute-binding protein [Thermoanaerobaculia bacterium]|nr:extracellular solute-binding protein [Thermoanaerobaculia bacterium]
MTQTFRSLRALVALAALTVLGCGDGRKPVVLYSPHGGDLLALMEKEFETRNPDVDVRWLDMGSQDVYDRVRSEAANPQADVWFGGPQTIFARGAREGLLDPYRPQWADQIPPESRNADNLFFGSYRTAPVLVYNSAAVKPEDAPRDWDDLLDPKWTGKILIRDPLASGTMRTMFGMILSRSVAQTGSPEQGFAWLRRLDGQTKEYLQQPALMIEKLNRQEGLVTIWELTDLLWQRHRGSPLAFHFPTSGTPVIDDSVGLVKNAPHPEEAKKFIDFVGSPEGQEIAARQSYRLPARTDLPADKLPDWAREVLRDMKPAADVRWDLIEKNGQEWMSTWDRTVRGKGAVSPTPAAPAPAATGAGS